MVATDHLTPLRNCLLTIKCEVLSLIQCALILCFCLVLKVVETVGIKHVRGTEDYDDAIKKDIRKLNLMKGILHTVRTRF